MAAGADDDAPAAGGKKAKRPANAGFKTLE
jgi:hypothetical protein